MSKGHAAECNRCLKLHSGATCPYCPEKRMPTGDIVCSGCGRFIFTQGPCPNCYVRRSEWMQQFSSLPPQGEVTNEHVEALADMTNRQVYESFQRDGEKQIYKYAWQRPDGTWMVGQGPTAPDAAVHLLTQIIGYHELQASHHAERARKATVHIENIRAEYSRAGKGSMSAVKAP